MTSRSHALIALITLSLVAMPACAKTESAKEDKNATSIVVGSEKDGHAETKGDEKQVGLEDQSVAGARDRADTTGGVVDTGDRIPATATRGDPMSTKSSGQ